MSQLILLPLKDASILKFAPESNLGSGAECYIGRFSNEETIYRTLLFFDLASIPKSSLIRKAVLTVYIQRNEIAEGESINLQTESLGEAFQEEEISWCNQPLLSEDFYFWRELKSGYKGWIEMDITYAARGWYHGWFENNGVLLSGNESVNSLVGIYSKEYYSEDLKPKLIVEYVEEKNSYYPVETIELGENQIKYSQAVLLCGAGAVSFFVTTDSEITATLQISRDGLNYFNVYFNFISPSNDTVLSTDMPCLTARVEISSLVEGAVVTVAPVIRGL